MTKEQLAAILAAIIDPIVGRFLADLAAQRLYRQLAVIDQEALDRLLASYHETVEVPT